MDRSEEYEAFLDALADEADRDGYAQAQRREWEERTAAELADTGSVPAELVPF